MTFKSLVQAKSSMIWPHLPVYKVRWNLIVFHGKSETKVSITKDGKEKISFSDITEVLLLLSPGGTDLGSAWLFAMLVHSAHLLGHVGNLVCDDLFCFLL